MSEVSDLRRPKFPVVALEVSIESSLFLNDPLFILAPGRHHVDFMYFVFVLQNTGNMRWEVFPCMGSLLVTGKCSHVWEVFL